MNIAAKVKRFAVWIGIAAYLALSLGGFREMVFCHEADGTVSLEAAFHGVCADSLEALSVAGDIGALQACGNQKCFDQSVQMASLPPDEGFWKNSPLSVQAVPMANVHPVIFGYLDTASGNVLAQPPPSGSPIHRFLKPIVLVI